MELHQLIDLLWIAARKYSIHKIIKTSFQRQQGIKSKNNKKNPNNEDNPLQDRIDQILAQTKGLAIKNKMITANKEYL